MKGPVTASGRDLHTLAGIVSDARGEPPAEGLVRSFLCDLQELIRCDLLVFEGHDSSQRLDWFGQAVPDVDGDPDTIAPFWEHYWDNLPCSYADLTGDVRRVTTISDFYSARQWHSSAMYSDCFPEVDHSIMVCLPADPRWTAGPGRTLRLILLRGPGPDFSERDRDLLTVLRPHLHQAYLDAERRRHPTPRLTARQRELLHLVAGGHTNAQIARRLGISEGTVRTHLENIYRLLEVSSRTAAVTRAFADRTG
jgi:DNA-binding CsgD family transcriptional regulator